MVRILLIDNYPFGGDVSERRRRFKEILKDVEFEILEFDKLNVKNLSEFDRIILSGSNLSLRVEENIEKYKDEIELVKSTEKPVLGICFGHQLIGVAFGFNIRKMESVYSEWGDEVKLRIKPFELCDKTEIIVEENHHEEIEYTPEIKNVFDILAGDDNCKIEIIRHKSKKIFGVQFHPETSPKSNIKDDGEEIIRNFVRLT